MNTRGALVLGVTPLLLFVLGFVALGITKTNNGNGKGDGLRRLQLSKSTSEVLAIENNYERRLASWTDGKKKSCTAIGYASYEYYLKGAGWDWEHDCKNTQLTINGKTFSGADRCLKTGFYPFGSMYGAFDWYPDSSCKGPYWGSFRDDDCDGDNRKYSSRIWGLNSGWRDWGAACRSLYGDIPVSFQDLKPYKCETFANEYWGKFKVYDIKCASEMLTGITPRPYSDKVEFSWILKDIWGVPFYTCSQSGAFIKEINLRSGAGLDAVTSFKCSDNSVNHLNVGGTGGRASTETFDSGFCGLEAGPSSYKQAAAQVKFTKCDSSRSKTIAYGTSNGGSIRRMECPSGEKLIGLQTATVKTSWWGDVASSVFRPVCGRFTTRRDLEDLHRELGRKEWDKFGPSLVYNLAGTELVRMFIDHIIKRHSPHNHDPNDHGTLFQQGPQYPEFATDNDLLSWIAEHAHQYITTYWDSPHTINDFYDDNGVRRIYREFRVKYRGRKHMLVIEESTKNVVTMHPFT